MYNWDALKHNKGVYINKSYINVKHMKKKLGVGLAIIKTIESIRENRGVHLGKNYIIYIYNILISMLLYKGMQ